MLKLALLGLVVAILTGCAALTGVPTFSGSLAYSELLTTTTTRTCTSLNDRKRISEALAIRCLAVVTEAGKSIDLARTVGAAGGGTERLAAAERILLDLERDLKQSEAKQ